MVTSSSSFHAATSRGLRMEEMMVSLGGWVGGWVGG